MLETDRLILRAYARDDFERVHAYGSLPDFSQYDVWGPNSEEDTRAFLKDAIEKFDTIPRSEFELAVCLKATGQLIGGCGIRRESQTSQVANIGYAINPEFQGQAYATEASKALVKFGFQSMDLKLIYATCDVRNIASYRVMEKVGLLQVGCIKNHKKVRGVMRDSYRYEICEGDFK